MKPSVLRLRVATAVVMAAVFVVSLYCLSAQAFAALFVPLILVAGWEWSNLCRLETPILKTGFLLLLFVCLTLTGFWLDFFGNVDEQSARQVLLLAVALWGLNLFLLMSYPRNQRFLSWRPLVALIGLLALSVTWGAVVVLLSMQQGTSILLLGVGVVICADVGGYFGGKVFGRRQLAPSVSPGKTWEGVVCGLLAQVVVVVIAVAAPLGMPLELLLLWVLPVALFSVLGDLFESMLKRHGKIKDSSQLLPGHGGILDRIDGIMAALPLYALLVNMRPV